MDIDLHADNGSELGPKQYHRGMGMLALVRYLRQQPEANIVAVMNAVAPDGWVVSSPERERQIQRMETLITIATTRPTQYGRHAKRPY